LQAFIVATLLRAMFVKRFGLKMVVFTLSNGPSPQGVVALDVCSIFWWRSRLCPVLHRSRSQFRNSALQKRLDKVRQSAVLRPGTASRLDQESGIDPHSDGGLHSELLSHVYGRWVLAASSHGHPVGCQPGAAVMLRTKQKTTL